MPTVLLGITAALAADPSKPNEEARQIAARVRASMFTKNWSWIAELDSPQLEVVLRGLAAWVVQAPNLDVCHSRLSGFILAFAVRYPRGAEWNDLNEWIIPPWNDKHWLEELPKIRWYRDGHAVESATLRHVSRKLTQIGEEHRFYILTWDRFQEEALFWFEGNDGVDKGDPRSILKDIVLESVKETLHPSEIAHMLSFHPKVEPGGIQQAVKEALEGVEACIQLDELERAREILKDLEETLEDNGIEDADVFGVKFKIDDLIDFENTLFCGP